jgi:aspartate/methionine/tyrosine aminotransferase
MSKRQGRTGWRVAEVVVEEKDDAPEIEMGAYSRLMARILGRHATDQAKNQAA